MRLARKLGMISYRSGEEWAERFGRERAPDFAEQDTPFGIDFEVESYLESHADRFIGSFDANCYLYLSRAMDLFDGLDHGGSLAASFSGSSAGICAGNRRSHRRALSAYLSNRNLPMP